MCAAQIQEQPLHYLHLATLREYLRFEFADLTGLDVSTNRARPKTMLCLNTLSVHMPTALQQACTYVLVFICSSGL